MKTPQFLALTFFGGCVADVLLRDLDRPRFRPYFASRGIVEAALLGGLTVVAVTGLTSAVVSHRKRAHYVAILLLVAWAVSWFYERFEPFGPELRPHTRSRDGRLLDLLTALAFIPVMFAAETYVVPWLATNQS